MVRAYAGSRPQTQLGQLEAPLRIHFARAQVAVFRRGVPTDGLTVCPTDIDAYLKANLLEPFGMTSSGYVWQTSLELTAAAHDQLGI